MLPEAGHLNPSFPLAKALKARGHEVVYTSLPDLEDSVRHQGFGFRALHADQVPPGRLPEIDQFTTESDRDLAWDQIRDCISEDYFDGRTLKQAVLEIEPDIILADIVSASPMQYIAHALGLPCLQLSTSFSQRFDELPPLLSPCLPNASLIEIAASQWESSSVRIFGPIPFTSYICRAVDSYCARFAYPRNQVNFQSTFAATLNTFPEAILASSVLDFPRNKSSKPHYLAVPVDVQRKEIASDELDAFVERERPLIYASLGSQPGRYAHADLFFKALIAAMRELPHLKAVVSTGPKYFSNRLFADLPDNILLLKSVPQLWVLRRSGIFITHGGLGSAREALALQVPMIVIPQQYDQLGNAARIVYHGLGERIQANFINGRTLVSAIERIFDNMSAYKQRLSYLSQLAAQEEARDSGVVLIEKIASSAPKKSNLQKPQEDAFVKQSTPGRAWLFVGTISGFTHLQPGRVIQCKKIHQEVGLTKAGFVAYKSLEAALTRAAGPMLVHVELSNDVCANSFQVMGRKMRCLWRVDLTEELFSYARWCATQALNDEKQNEPETVAAFEELIDSFHERRLGSDSERGLVNFSLSILDKATRILERGYAASAASVNLSPHFAAKLARYEAIIALLRKQCNSTDQSVSECEQKYHELANHFDKEFRSRISSSLLPFNTRFAAQEKLH